MIVDCHIIRHCLALSPLLASLQHTPPGHPNIPDHLDGIAKGSAVVMNCRLLLTYFSIRSTQLLIVMSPQTAVTYTDGAQ